MVAVRFLSTCSKFSSHVGGSSSHAAGYGPSSQDLTGRGKIGIDMPSLQRRSGAKKRKTEEKVQNTSEKMVRSVDKMSEALRASAQAKSDTASVMLEFRILRSMSPPESTVIVELRTLKGKASKLHYERKKENDDENRDVQVAGTSIPSVDPVKSIFGGITSSSSF